jgi:hypothetical protein
MRVARLSIELLQWAVIELSFLVHPTPNMDDEEKNFKAYATVFQDITARR